MESLTDEIEARARAYVERIDELGGAAKAIDYMQREIQSAAYSVQLEIEAGTRVVVGVNEFVEESETRAAAVRPDYADLEGRQQRRVAELRGSRDAAATARALDAVAEAARGDSNVVPPILRAVKSMATLGEISDVLRREWGTFDPGYSGGGAAAGGR